VVVEEDRLLCLLLPTAAGRMLQVAVDVAVDVVAVAVAVSTVVVLLGSAGAAS
jgi:hypothetical protein